MEYLNFWILVSSFCVLEVNSFILIPEELPSVLQLFYSKVPPVKKGTDSRIGVGFRLGPNADLQVQFEMGPQTNTQQIGLNTNTSSTSSRKRQTSSFNEPRTRKISKNVTNSREKFFNTWKFNFNEDARQNLQEAFLKSDPTRENNEFVNQLRKLYDSGSNFQSKTGLMGVK